MTSEYYQIGDEFVLMAVAASTTNEPKVQYMQEFREGYQAFLGLTVFVL